MILFTAGVRGEKWPNLAAVESYESANVVTKDSGKYIVPNTYTCEYIRSIYL